MPAHKVLWKDCSVLGCDRSAASRAHGKRGMCCAHAKRAARHNGDPTAGTAGQGEIAKWVARHAGHKGRDCLFCDIGIRPGHRFIPEQNMMCEIRNGPRPTPSHQSAHSCGNGHIGCLNPNHLSWKTPVENQADR